MEVVLLYTTWPDAGTADACARAAVEARLAACVHVAAPVTSTYRWEGAVETAAEVPALFKTTAARAAELRALILRRHPYELPAVVALPIVEAASHAPFLAWVAAETSPSQRTAE